ncbi:hypothetical protein E2C01_061466 [Portunus trituberculatus]|uniref:Uncharacterized protein n=1 Tax=Portunus trituberculatus TaxID=210409 RepID=A0A5B7HB12_PORTR|nr:hypothetical protein [Portunus trituberculatus]
MNLSLSPSLPLHSPSGRTNQLQQISASHYLLNHRTIKVSRSFKRFLLYLSFPFHLRPPYHQPQSASLPYFPPLLPFPASLACFPPQPPSPAFLQSSVPEILIPHLRRSSNTPVMKEMFEEGVQYAAVC